MSFSSKVSGIMCLKSINVPSLIIISKYVFKILIYLSDTKFYYKIIPFSSILLKISLFFLFNFCILNVYLVQYSKLLIVMYPFSLYLIIISFYNSSLYDDGIKYLFVIFPYKRFCSIKYSNCSILKSVILFSRYFNSTGNFSVNNKDSKLSIILLIYLLL